MFFLSCAQNVPDINSANYKVIFEYESENSFPNSRMSIFVESESDCRRFEKFVATSLENGFKWNLEDLIKFQDKDGNYFCGHTSLVMPEGMYFPEGIYNVEFFDFNGESDFFEIEVFYDVQIFEIPENSFEDFIKEKNAVQNISIFDSKGEMIYFGEKNEELKDARSIYIKYRDAEYFRDVWITQNEMCIMPSKYVKNEIDVNEIVLEEENNLQNQNTSDDAQ